MTTIRIALRSLFRNRWRTVLTVGGIAVAVALLIWAQHMANAMMDTMVDAVTRIEMGDAQVTTKAFTKEQNLYNAFELEPEQLEAIRNVPGVEGAAPRVQVFGLVGNEAHSQIARILGVDRDAEPQVSLAPSKVIEGTWLTAEPEDYPAPREVVLGKTLAEQLKTSVGNELVVFLQGADGSLGDDKLRVMGIATTGSSALDRAAVWMHLGDVQELTVLEGRAHQVVLTVERGRDLAQVVDAVRGVLPAPAKVPEGEEDDGTGTLVTRTWKEIVPELHQMVEVTRSSMWIYYIIIYLICGLGILNTQRMSALERRREFGVLLAVGTTPGRMVRQVLTESVLLTTAGAIAGGIIGTALSWYHQENGLDLTMGKGVGGMSWMGVNFDLFYFQLSTVDVLEPVLAILFVGLLCGLWPALKSALLDIPRAISGRA